MEQSQNPLESADINSVGKDQLLIIEKHWFLAILAILIAVGCCWFAWYVNNYQFAIAGFVFVLLGLGLVGNKARAEFMEQIASALGYQYIGSTAVSSVSANLFKVGHSQSISNAMQGTHGGFPLRIYDFQTKIGYGKNEQTFPYTVFEITYPYDLPPFLMLAHEGLFGGIGGGDPTLPQGTFLKLEGDFNKYFTVSVEKNFEMEALEILTPDVMNDFVQKSRGINFELSDHRLYIFQHGTMSKKEPMSRMYDTAILVSGMLDTHFKEVSGDVDAMKEEKENI